MGERRRFRLLPTGATARFALIYFLLFALSVLLLLGWVYFRTVPMLDRQAAETVAAELRGLAEQAREGGLQGLVEALERRTGEGGDPDGVYLLVGPDGRKLAGNLRAWPPEAEGGGEWVLLDLRRRTEEGLQERIVGARSFALPSGHRLLVGRDFSARARYAGALVEALGWALVGALALGVGGGWLISRNVARRVGAVTATSQRIMRGDLSQRMPKDGSGDEFDRLSDSLNAMLQRIEELMTGLRTVSDSLAHDLRSPLTRLKGRIELALRGPEDPAAYREALEKALAEADHLLSTFSGLLSIARAEAGAAKTQFESLDLGQLAAELGELYEPAASEAGLAWHCEIESPAPVLGHRQLLAQLLSNLLDNALKYGSGGDALSLEVRSRPHRVELVVADTGAGIPAAARASVLQRFVRLDESRRAPGSGLGLSLVAAVAKLHGADLRLEDNAPGLRVRLVFERAEDALV
jgi:signal transduction histidine kinase